MTIAVIDYGLGNVTSVAGAVEKLGFDAIITDKQSELTLAEKLILPGVGAFGDGMANLHKHGLADVLTELVMEKKKPVLGICLGFQLLAEESDEFGSHKGLGWVKGRVRRLAPADPALRVPHVGWNDLEQTQESLLYRDVPRDSLFYYVHSFALPSDLAYTVGTCSHGETFSAALQSGNIYGTQFHPEKSQQAGLTLLGNFLKYA
jgi:glutamine amidotransferase